MIEPKKCKGLCFIHGHPDDIMTAQRGAVGRVHGDESGAMNGIHKSMMAAQSKVHKR